MMQKKYNAPDETLWRDLRRALGDVPMALSAHQSVQRLFDQVEQEAAMRQMRTPDQAATAFAQANTE